MKKIGFIFPGQGSQAVGMLADFAKRYPAIEDTFAEASVGAAVDLWRLVQEGPAEKLNQTEFTQPALLAASVALWRVWQQAGGAKPNVLAGHSLGEYSALVCAGALSLVDGAALVRFRGQAMQSAVPTGTGAMAAILGAEEALIEEACAAASADGRIASPANYNCPGQVVIAGHADAVDRVLCMLQVKGVRKAIKLPVSVPSHCVLMKPAADALREKIASIAWRMPEVPVVQNVDGVAYGALAEIQAALTRQLFLPVRWAQCMGQMAAQGVDAFYECGPEKVLTGLARRIDKSIACAPLSSLGDFEASIHSSKTIEDLV